MIAKESQVTYNKEESVLSPLVKKGTSEICGWVISYQEQQDLATISS